MKVSTRGRYGLRILFDLARFGADKPRTIGEIASSQMMSEKYVSQLTLKLKNAGFIISQRGFGGGYKLKRKPENITVLDVVEIMDGPISIVDCVDTPTTCKKSNSCSVRNSWTVMNKKIRKVLSETTLQDILNSDEPMSAFDYCI